MALETVLFGGFTEFEAVRRLLSDDLWWDLVLGHAQKKEVLGGFGEDGSGGRVGSYPQSYPQWTFRVIDRPYKD